MAITNYSELKTAIADFLNRDDLTSAIPTFISLAEADIARKVRHWSQEKRVTTNVDQRYEGLPSDFLEAVRVQLNDGQLRPMSSDQMASERKRQQDTAGEPKYFYLSANQIELYPTPSESTELSLLYYARVPALSDSEPTNWMLTNNPDVLLYGALVHSAPYLQEDARSALWAGLYQNAVDSLNRESNITQASGGALVMRVK